ncbi:hypothetical protein [Corallococcus macrosporus]|uniref:Uncharacterized protein n=1 Tax=Corallococcus macrosporus DSM 14697 TaxID=1189310 RepID=A0A250JZ18_9BACT|nr:hypothetical protein [Corallococcus macrosporus]ATB48356.1 hypothetical protein MYMAC_003983 [Corallococcus macrosporus DSM 14697]
MARERSPLPSTGSRLTRRIHGLISACAVSLPTAAGAAEYLDTPYAERRAFSLILGPGASYTELINRTEDDAEKGGDAHLDLGASRTVGYDGDEVFVVIRGSLRGPELSVAGGYRSFHGDGSWQTFYDLGLLIRPFSGPWLGPRVALGLRHTFSERLAVFGGLGLSLGFGAGLRGDAEAFTGVQWIFPVGSK